MIAAHTPGPWAQDIFTAVNGDQCFGVKSTTTHSAVAWSHGRTVEEDIANARLISAALDLLASVRTLLRDMQEVDAVGSFGIEYQVSMDQAHKSIEKATGATA